MAQDHTVRLLVVEPSLNDAETLISVLRNAGHAVRPTRAATEDQLREALDQHSHDLILCDRQAGDLTIPRVRELAAEFGRDAPLVAFAGEYDEETVHAAMKDGACDLVSKQHRAHLDAVVRRELENLKDRRALRRADQARREAEKRCASLLDSSRDAITYVQDGMHMYANAAYLALFGFDSPDEIEGTPVMDIIGPDHHDELKRQLRQYGIEGKTDSDEMDAVCQRIDGSSFNAHLEFYPAHIENEPCTQIVIRDQSQSSNAKELEDKLKDLSKQDLLTGLYNRPHFMELLDEAISYAVKNEVPSALMCLDLDEFDRFKESAGIAGTDLVVSDIASLVKQQLGEHDAAARLSDSTFALLLAGQDVKDAEPLAENLRSTIEAHISEVNGQSFTTTTSIGLCPIGESSPQAQELISRAQRATEQSRQAGGNRASTYNPVSEDRVNQDQDQQWIERIRHALEHHQFRLYYQPIASLHGDVIERYEVLLRLIDDEGNVLGPGQFIPVAEQHGLIHDVDRWVVQESVRQLAERRRNGHDTAFFVKLSGHSLNDQELLPWLAQLLKNERLQGDALVFEIPESTAVTYLKDAKQFVKGVKQLRCQFALEQFGNGVNSFHILKHLPADYLKIDRSFMRDLPNSQENQEGVRQITEQAHSMSKRVVAEHVEDAGSLPVLWQLGANFIQGHFLQEPTDRMDFDFTE